MENPKEVAEHNATATIQNFSNILEPKGNVTTIDASEYISTAQGASKPHLRPRNKVQFSQTTKQQQAMIVRQNLACNRPLP